MSSDFVKIIGSIECPNLKTEPKQDKWLRENNYYQTVGDKYGSLFEKCYPTEVDRREYIESQVDGKVPSLGYIALAHLIKLKTIDTLITTNFDDLIFIAATSFTDIRPVVYSLGGFASEISGTTNRPRVLKLHGDFLFSRLKNIETELESQDPNMSQQVQQILESYRGLVVIGNSGNDKSILDLIARLPVGKYLYWCTYKDEVINPDVERLVTEKKGWIVKTDGFDDLLNQIRITVGINDDQIFDLFEERRRNLEKEVEKVNPVKFANLQRAVEFLTRGNGHARNEELTAAKIAFEKAIDLEPGLFFPYVNLAWVLYGMGLNDKSEVLFNKAIEIRPDSPAAYTALGNFLFRLDRIDDAIKAYNKALELNSEYFYPMVGLASIYDVSGETDLAIKYRNLANKLANRSSNFELLYVHALERDKTNTLKYLRLYSQEQGFWGFTIRTSRTLDWIKEDARFKRITGSK